MLPLCYAAPPLHFKNEKNRRALGYDGINSFNMRKIIVYLSGEVVWFDDDFQTLVVSLVVNFAENKQIVCHVGKLFKHPRKSFSNDFRFENKQLCDTFDWNRLVLLKIGFAIRPQPPFLPILLWFTVLDYCNA